MKKQVTTAKVGRPTKYNGDILKATLLFIEDRLIHNLIPTKEGLAVRLDIDTDTVVEWAKEHKEFSVAIKKLASTQADMLQTNVVAQRYNPAGAIFLLKNNHGFKDQQNVDLTTAGKPLPAPILGGISDNNDSDKKDLGTK